MTIKEKFDLFIEYKNQRQCGVNIKSNEYFLNPDFLYYKHKEGLS